MIIKAFSDYLKEFNSDIPCVILLSRWLKEKLSKQPKNNIEKIIHKEISLFVNKEGKFMIVGNNKDGKLLLESLYNFALSYEQQTFSRWIHDKKASDFKN
jgi:ABC-type polysaccharide/polyol phosphate transport system ATPase subunit